MIKPFNTLVAVRHATSAMSSSILFAALAHWRGEGFVLFALDVSLVSPVSRVLAGERCISPAFELDAPRDEKTASAEVSSPASLSGFSATRLFGVSVSSSSLSSPKRRRVTQGDSRPAANRSGPDGETAVDVGVPRFDGNDRPALWNAASSASSQA